MIKARLGFFYLSSCGFFVYSYKILALGEKCKDNPLTYHA